MKGSTVYITWGEKSCLDEQCSHVNIKYNYTKSDDLLSFKKPVNLFIMTKMRQASPFKAG
jgi:hypothetical protein